MLSSALPLRTAANAAPVHTHRPLGKSMAVGNTEDFGEIKLLTYARVGGGGNSPKDRIDPKGVNWNEEKARVL